MNSATHEVVEMFVCVRHLPSLRWCLQNKKQNMGETRNEITISTLSDSRSGWDVCVCVLGTCPVCGGCGGASRTKIKTLVKAAMNSATHEVVEMFVCVRHLPSLRCCLRNKKQNMGETRNEITISMLSDSRSGWDVCVCVLGTCPVWGGCGGASRRKIKALVKAAMKSQSLCLATHEVVEMFVCVRHLSSLRLPRRCLQNKNQNIGESRNELSNSWSGWDVCVC